VTIVLLWPHRSAIVSIGTSLSLRMDTNECLSSRGVQSSPMPAALVMARNARRTLPASSAVPIRVQNARSLSSHASPAMRVVLSLVVPFVPEALGAALTRAGWSWADGQGDFDLRAPGLVFRQRRTQSVPRHLGRTLPTGSGSFAIIRALIRFGGEGEEPGATALSARAGVSQARASQVLHQLQDLSLVDRAGRGRWRPDQKALLDRFLAEYPGPGGSEAYFYTLDPVTDVTVRAAGVLGPELAVSADVGPDLILAWRRPSKVIWYVRRLIAASELGLVQAQGQHDANVVVRMPKDHSVFPAPPPVAAEAQGAEIGLADPAQMVWDLHDLGRADRIEAAEELYKWLLKHP